MKTQKTLKALESRIENKSLSGFIKYGVTASILAGMAPFAVAKVRPANHYSPKSNGAHVTKDIHAEATFTLQQSIQLPAEMTAFQFQNGKASEDIDFYKSPRCYLHFKKNAQASVELPAGKTLKISKIDNTYERGAVHITFWFDSDQAISDLSCITNYNHTLTVNELKDTLGNAFQVNLPKQVEVDALTNTAPRRNAPVLSEDASNYNNHSTRVILSDS